MKRSNSEKQKNGKIAFGMLFLIAGLLIGFSASTSSAQRREFKNRSSQDVYVHQENGIHRGKNAPVFITRTWIQPYPYRVYKYRGSGIRDHRKFKPVRMHGRIVYVHKGIFYAKKKGRFIRMKSPSKYGNF